MRCDPISNNDWKHDLICYFAGVHRVKGHTLYEDDLLFDDKIGSKTISRSPDESTNWEETVTFTFSPKKFEIGATLELYAKVGGVKSNVIRIRCK